MKNIRKSYKIYKENADQLLVGLSRYLKINADFNKFMIEQVLDGDEVILPRRLGSLYIVGKKPKISFDEEGNVKGLAPDWPRTWAFWNSNPEAKAERKYMYHLNEHTSQIRYKYKWSKKRALVKNKTLYTLVLSRTNKRAASARIKSGQEYITTDYK